MLIAWKRTAIAGLACLIAAPANAQLIQRKDLSYAMAKSIAENALADCKARGYAVSVDEPCVNAGIDKVKDQLQ
jgi:hypothetical protein